MVGLLFKFAMVKIGQFFLMIVGTCKLTSFFSSEQTRLPCCSSKMVLSSFRGPGVSLPAIDSG